MDDDWGFWGYPHDKTESSSRVSVASGRWNLMDSALATGWHRQEDDPSESPTFTLGSNGFHDFLNAMNTMNTMNTIHPAYFVFGLQWPLMLCAGCAWGEFVHFWRDLWSSDHRAGEQTGHEPGQKVAFSVGVSMEWMVLEWRICSATSLGNHHVHPYAKEIVENLNTICWFTF